MSSGTDLERRLESAAARLHVGDAPVERLVARGRRRVVRRRMEAVVVGAVVLGVLGWSFASLLPGAPVPRPAQSPRVDRRAVQAVQTGLRVSTSIAVVGDSVWIGSDIEPIVIVDPRTGRVVTTTQVTAKLEATAFGSVWALRGATLLRLATRAGTGVFGPYPLVEGRIPLGSSTVGPVVPGFGSLWALDGTDGVVLRIDPGVGRVVATIPLPRPMRTGRVFLTPPRLAVGDGAVWVAGGGTGLVVRIDPDAGRVDGALHVLPPVRIEGQSATGSMVHSVSAVGGRLWVCCDGGILEVDPTTGRRIGDPVAVEDFADPELPLYVLDGRLWAQVGAAFWGMSGRQAPGSWFYRIDPTSHRALGFLVSPASGPTVVADRLFWTIDQYDGTLARVDPSGRLQQLSVVRPGASGSHVAVTVVVLAAVCAMGAWALVRARRLRRSPTADGDDLPGADPDVSPS